MTSALNSLLAGCIDYAGLFPPARLPLETAVAGYAGYLRSGDAWMLGKFICPVARLGELEDLVPPPGAGWSISALGQGGDTLNDWVKNLNEDFDRIVDCGLSVASLEVRLPNEAFTTPDGVIRCLDAFSRPGDGIFIEVPPGPDFLERVTTTLAALREWSGSGFKLRCGGLEAAAFPDPRVVAQILREAVVAGVPLKATAGLHHPLRRWDEPLQTWMHGFVNLFFGALIAQVGQSGEEERVAVLLDRDPSAFHFTQESASWRGYTWTLEAVETMRREQVLSFGSCSFDEPRDDLRELGWLPPSGGA